MAVSHDETKQAGANIQNTLATFGMDIGFYIGSLLLYGTY